MDKRLEYFDLKEINAMEEFVFEYERAIKKTNQLIEELLKFTTDESLIEDIKALKEPIETNEKSRYEDYKEKLEDFENFSENDYNNNDGLDQEYITGKIGGIM